MAASSSNRWWDNEAADTEHCHFWDREQNSDEDVETDPLSDPAAAADEYLDHMIGLYMSNKITADNFCVANYWAGLANICGGISKYGKKPGCSSGDYQRFLDDKLGFVDAKQNHYNVSVPGHRRSDLSRSTFNVPVRLAHECIEKEVASDDSIGIQLQEAIDDNSLPPSYFAHPVVQANPLGEVLPVALYMDKVPYTQTDSVCGIWAVNMITNKRHILATVRSRIQCRCGCRGYDTYYPVMWSIRWTFECGADGVLPALRHDLSEFVEQDLCRKGRAGQKMKLKLALIQIRVDWAELCERFGFPTWQSCTGPCPGCNAFGDQLYMIVGVSALGMPWYCNTDEDFEVAIARCEIKVNVMPAQHAELLDILQYDKKPQGGSGRCLTKDYPGLCLLKGDRLEPTEQLPDVAHFERMVVPATGAMVLFWRRSRESLARRRCPLFSKAIGILPMLTIVFDLLHTLYLGPVLVFVKRAIWTLLSCGSWGGGTRRREPLQNVLPCSCCGTHSSCFIKLGIRITPRPH